jgi:hypothetical protein
VQVENHRVSKPWRQNSTISGLARLMHHPECTKVILYKVDLFGRI